MSSARKRTYKHKAYAEIDHLKQRLMLIEHHYSVMKAAAEVLAAKGDALIAENKELRDTVQHLIDEAKLTSNQYELCRQALATKESS